MPATQREGCGQEGSRRWWQRPSVAAVLLALVVISFVVTGIAEYTAPQASGGMDPSSVWWGISTTLPFPIVGYLIVRRVPANRIGWLFLIGPLFLSVSSMLGGFMTHWRENAPWIAVYAATASFFLGGGLIAGYALLWFPTGRPPTPRWRWVGVLAAVGLVLFMTGTQSCVTWEIRNPAPGEVTPQFCGDPAGPSFAEFHSPIDLGVVSEVPVSKAVTGIGFIAVAIAFFAGIVSLVVRFRRAIGDERNQLRWPFVVVAAIGLLIVVGLMIEFLGGDAGFIGDATMQVAGIGIPVSIWMAVTRFRLYDVDRVISRTVTYSIVALLLAALYGTVTLGPVLVLGEGQDSPSWVVALATLAAFVLFQPLRRRVQDIVDGRFNRARYDAQAVVERFADRVRDETDLGAVTAGLGEVAARVFQPVSLGIWMRSSQ